MTTEVIDVVSGFRWPKWALILFGILSVIAGVLTLVWPGVTILALIILLGLDILIWGVMLMVNAFDTGQGRVLAVTPGVRALSSRASPVLPPRPNVDPGGGRMGKKVNLGGRPIIYKKTKKFIPGFLVTL